MINHFNFFLLYFFIIFSHTEAWVTASLLSSAAVWVVSIFPLITWFLTLIFGTLAKFPAVVAYIVTFMFNNLFCSLGRFRYLSRLLHSFIFILWITGMEKFANWYIFSSFPFFDFHPMVCWDVKFHNWYIFFFFDFHSVVSREDKVHNSFLLVNQK